MRRRGKAALLPAIILLGSLPAVMLPLMVALRPPVYVMGLFMGIPIGLALVGIFWMAKGVSHDIRFKRRRSNGS